MANAVGLQNATQYPQPLHRCGSISIKATTSASFRHGGIFSLKVFEIPESIEKGGRIVKVNQEFIKTVAEFFESGLRRAEMPENRDQRGGVE
jgi:hypothetical protein